MPTVSFIRSNGVTVDVDYESGASVMETAMRANLTEIIAECGGACACGTCHLYVSPEYLDRLPVATDAENEMLEFIEVERRTESRLSCQLILSDEHDGAAFILTRNG